jgi:hypothetical protein
MVQALDPNKKQKGLQFHHVVPQCLLKKENRKSNVDGVYCTFSQHEKLHHLLADSYKEDKNYFFRLCKALIQWSDKSVDAKHRVIGVGPTRGTTGIKQSDEWVEKKRKALLGQKRSPEQRERMRVAQTGIPKPNSRICAYQLSRPWRHPRVSGNTSRVQDWSKSQEVYELLEVHPDIKHADAIRKLGFISRRTYCNIFGKIQEGWVPGLDSEWVHDFVKI